RQGYYVNPNADKLKNALIYCATNGQLFSCRVMDGMNGYFTSRLGNEYVIKCDGSGCKEVKLESVTCGYENLLPVCDRTDAGNTCHDGATDTYCIGTDAVLYKNVVGDVNSCTPLVPEETETDGKFYFDGNGQKVTGPAVSYYKCTVSGSAISGCAPERAKLPACKASIKAAEVCREGATEGEICISNGNLYETGDGTCTPLKGVSNAAVYIGEDYRVVEYTSARYTLQCSTGGTAAAPRDLKSCSYLEEDAGGAIKTSSGPKMCTSKDDGEALDIAGEKSYQVVKVKANKFPGVSAEGAIRLKVSGPSEGLIKGILKLEEGVGLPTCVNSNAACKYSNTETVAFCSRGGVVYKTTLANTCVKVTNRDTDEHAFMFFGRDFTQVDPTQGQEVYYAYQCTFNADVAAGEEKEAVECAMVQGVVKTGNTSVTCNGWKNDVCRVDRAGAACSDGVGGVVGGLTGICFGDEAVAFPKDHYRYAAFTTTTINDVYGVEKGRMVVVKMTPYSAVKVDYSELGDETVYLIDHANPANAEGKTPLIKCTAGECQAVEADTRNKVTGEVEAVVEEGKALAYYIDGAYPFGNQIITCTQAEKNAQGVVTDGSCTSAAPQLDNDRENIYFVDSGAAGQLITCDGKANAVGYGDLPICEKESEDNYYPCISTAGDGDYCVRKGVLFVSGAGSCAKVITCTSATSPVALYSSGSDVADQKIIKCDGEGEVTCAYLPDLACKNAETEESINDGKIIINDDKFMVCKNGAGEQVDKDLQGYRLMTQAEAGNLFTGVGGELLMENRISSILSIKATAPRYGYYVNVGDDYLTHPIIKCSEGGPCEAVEVTDVHCRGDRTKLPVCTNTASDAACVTGDGKVDTHCVKNGKIYRTLNKEDEKCREIQALEICESIDASEKCISTAQANDLCLRDGKTYITVGSGCKEISTLDECENTESGSKCMAQATAGDVCRSSTTGKIYASGEESCEEVASPLDSAGEVKFYFSATYAFTSSASTADVKTVYRCNQRNGVLSSCEKSVQSPGGLIYTQSGGAKDVKLCVNELESPAANSKAVNANQGYQTIYSEKVDAFPGASLPGVSTIMMEKYNPYLVKEMETLPDCDVMVSGKVCKTNGNDVTFCVMNKVLYQSGADSCTKVTGTGKYSFIYFDSTGQAISESSLNPRSDLAFIYKCDYGTGGEAERCVKVQGYVVRNNVLINCNGWHHCTVARVNGKAEACKDVGEGTMTGNGKSICFDIGGEEVVKERLPTAANSPRYVMFKAAMANALYGQNENDVVVLALTSDSVTVVPFGDGIAKGYHQNVKVVDDLADALIYCGQEGVLESCRVVNGLNGYYLNYDSDKSTVPVIKCEEELGCHKQSVEKSSCGKGDAGAIIKSGQKIYICRDDSGGKEELGLEAAYLKYKSVSPIDASFPGVIEENKSYVKIGDDGSVTLLDDGVHLNEKVKGKVEQAIYTCSTETVTTTCIQQDAVFGYYRNAGTRHAEDTFIACSVNGCEGIAVNANAECNENRVGQLFGPDPSLCLYYDVELGREYDVALEGTSLVGYMVGYYNGNVFGLEKDAYAYVNVNATIVQLKTDYEKYVYIQSDDLKEKSGDCPVKENQLNEFKIADDSVYGIYQLNCVEGDEADNLYVYIK
ncbi:hypothetical protein PIROE2DRAFT_1531, partial [Piromyces sp. E2]